MHKIFLLLLLTVYFIAPVLAQEKPLPADVVLQQSFTKAKAAHKNVFVIFHASWCGWCHKMDAAMNDAVCKKFFNDNYVITHLTVMENKDKQYLENPGGRELLQKYKGEKSGIPFWLIFNDRGELLATSLMENGDNTGCPATEKEAKYFTEVLSKTSSLKEKELQIIYDRFRKNDVTH